MPAPCFRIDFYTDGACPGNGGRSGGPMGAGIVAQSGEFRKEWGLPLGQGTNQQAELLAIREALRRVRRRELTEVCIFSDSAYAIGLLTLNWKAKANQQIVAEVRQLAAECARFRMCKVEGHAGIAANERADKLAVAAARTGKVYFNDGSAASPSPAEEHAMAD